MDHSTHRADAGASNDYDYDYIEQDLDEAEDDLEDVLADAPRLASRWWSGPSGMTGGAAEDELVVSPDGRILHIGSGDSPAALYGPDDLGPAAADPTEVIADWLGSIDGSIAAALELEPLDPAGELDEHERSTWTHLIANRHEGVSFHLDDEAVQALRTLMRRDAHYVEVAAALRDPRAPQSRELLNELCGQAFAAGQDD